MSTIVQHHPVGITWHESTAMSRAAHAVADGDRVWLIDPFEDAAALQAAAMLGQPAAVIQLLDRHQRDGQAIAQRLGVPLLRLPAALPDTPFTVASVAARPWWREIALWWHGERTLIVAEAVGTAPLFALDRPVGVHPMLRLLPPRSALGRFAPERLLVGHGPALESGAASALRDALVHSRGDVPKLLLKLPSAIRDAR
ncbi:MAG: hypothetical protein ACR2NR_10380 [Solirubrobacteraceae bacterium]